MVDTKSEVAQWERYKTGPSTSNYTKQCIQKRLRGSLQWINDRRMRS